MANDAQPLKVLEGVQHKLEIYTDRIVLRHRNWLSVLVPAVFGSDETIYIRDVTDFEICGTRVQAGNWIHIIVRSAKKYIALPCHTDQYPLAHQMKDLVEKLRSQQRAAAVV